MGASVGQCADMEPEVLAISGLRWPIRFTLTSHESDLEERNTHEIRDCFVCGRRASLHGRPLDGTDVGDHSSPRPSRTCASIAPTRFPPRGPLRSIFTRGASMIVRSPRRWTRWPSARSGRAGSRTGLRRHRARNGHVAREGWLNGEAPASEKWLRTWGFVMVERVTGVEPALSAWESVQSTPIHAPTCPPSLPRVTVIDPCSLCLIAR
jgi:hypothetical protein